MLFERHSFYGLPLTGCPSCPQEELEELQRVLKEERMAAEQVHASREKAQAELKKVSCSDEI